MYTLTNQPFMSQSYNDVRRGETADRAEDNDIVLAIFVSLVSKSLQQ